MTTAVTLPTETEMLKVALDENNGHYWIPLDNGDFLCCPATTDTQHYITIEELTDPTEPEQYYFDYLTAILADRRAFAESHMEFFRVPRAAFNALNDNNWSGRLNLEAWDVNNEDEWQDAMGDAA